MTAPRKKIFAISGSTRLNSSNEAILKTVAELSIETFDVHIFQGISELPHFNPDLDNEDSLPLPIKDFREQIESADGVILCTPEYVFNLPGSLKNALDWIISTLVFSDKPVALITAAASGEKAHEYLELIMNTVGAKVGEHSRLLIQGVKGKIDENGNVIDEPTLVKLKKMVESFEKSIG